VPDVRADRREARARVSHDEATGFAFGLVLAVILLGGEYYLRLRAVHGSDWWRNL
jgi:hypothetical protein